MIFDIHIHESINSTMDIATAKAEKGAKEWTVIQAIEQTSARGRRGNQWTSPKGNLYQTIIVRPTINRQYWGQMSFVVAVALAQSINDMTPDTPLALKWPNDVLINDKKLAGILIESGDDYLLIGTGINIENCPDDRSKIHDFHDISVNEFRDIFLINLKKSYDEWHENGFPLIRDKWMHYAYRLGGEIQARLPNITYEGLFEDLDENGVLLLRQKDGSLIPINSGEIIHVPGN